MPDVLAADFMVPRLASEDLVAQAGRLTEAGLLPEHLAAPLFVLWEITGKCPLDCPYCYNDSPRRVRELDTQALLRVADELIGMRVFGVCVTGGEPTARRDLLDLVHLLAASGVPVNMITSGWYMTPELAGALGTVLSNVTVSLDGSRADIHDAVRRRRGSFDRAVRAIGLFQEHGLDQVHVSFACTPSNANDLPALVELCRRLGVRSLRTHPIAVTGKAGINTTVGMVPATVYRKVEEFIAGLPRDGMLVQWLDPTGHMRLGHALGRVFGLRITAEGHLGFSPYLPLVMGNVTEQPIQECWDAGLCMAWRHPEVRELLAAVESITDLRLTGDDGLTFRRLDPTEARCSPATVS
jgi:MoaA/NifB/PqqE/SkfB family radical SAM enzyme